MFKRAEAKSIGKVFIPDISKIEEWLRSEEGRLYMIDNWSETRNREYGSNNWADGENIGFYNLQSTIPFFSDAEYIFRQLEDKTWKESTIETYIKNLTESREYFNLYNQTFDLLWDGGSYAVFCDQSKVYLLPSKLLVVEKFKDYDNIPIHTLRQLSGPQDNTGLIPAGTDISVSEVRSEIEEKKEKIEEASGKIKQLEEEKKAELEKFKAELETAYKEKFELIRKKKEELEVMKKELEGQLFLLDTEIYAIRSYNGETIQFTRLMDGIRAKEDTPFVIYQKIRYLDVELGKYLAIYDFEGEDEELKYFEDILKYREDIRNTLLPTEKCCTLIRISESGVSYVKSSKSNMANILEACDKYHGHTLGILIRNGQETYIAWTDEERVSIGSGNVFMGNERSMTQIDKDTVPADFTTSKYEVASRYFLYATLQGVIDNTNITGIPAYTSILQPSPYIILSLADGWLEDNRFGTFEEILQKTNLPLIKGDMVLTTMHVTRDDIYSGRYSFSGHNTIHDTYNNNRGRGEKNRTHDVSLKNCTVYPINHVDRHDVYEITERHTYYDAKEIPGDEKVVKSTSGAVISRSRSISYEYTLKKDRDPELHTHTIEIDNYMYYDVNIKNREVEDFMAEINELYRNRGNYDGQKIMASYDNLLAYTREYVSTRHVKTTFDYFISEEKDGNYYWRETEKKARANMQIYPGEECINLTFLNSVWALYAIQNRKVGAWKIGGTTVDYATSIKYLNTALEYLREREKEEAELLEKYMKLPDEWQVALSEWKIDNNIHKLTDTRAKKFAREYTGKKKA